MNSSNQSLHKVFFPFLDLLALNCINLALLSSADKYVTNFYYYTLFCLFSNIAWMVCSYTSTMYVNNRHVDFRRLASRTLGAFVFYNCTLLLFSSVTLHQITNSYIIFDQCGFGLFLLFSRLTYILFVSYLFHADRNLRRIAFIGCNQHVKTLIHHFRANRQSAIIAGIFNDKNDLEPDIPFLGTINDCVSYAREHKITEIYSTLSPKIYPPVKRLADSAEKSFIKFRFVPDLSEFAGNNCKIDFIDDTAVISLRNEPMSDVSAQIQKRIFDIVFSSLVIIFLLSWLIPILAVLIKLDSKGPVFFTQLRSGKNNVPFKVIKLRTLKQNPDADSKQVTRGDDRITKLGKLLRKTNLDELPQFFNVLAGNMSVVGSRPHMLKHTTEYSQLYENYMLRHYTKPGITGWAQVNGFRGEISSPEQLRNRIEHDIWYIENWNIWLDFKIVYLTAYKMITGDENAF